MRAKRSGVHAYCPSKNEEVGRNDEGASDRRIGGLGQTLVPRLLDRGDTPVVLDVRAPPKLQEGAVFIQGSMLDRPKLPDMLRGCDCIVHIAAWHGLHEDRGGGMPTISST